MTFLSIQSSDAAAWVQGIGSLLAVAAALSIASWQQVLAQRQRREDREREHAAHRPLLLFPLDAVIDYCRRTAKTLIGNMPPDETMMAITPAISLLPLPEAAIRELAQGAASMPDPRRARPLIKLLQKLQITSARLRSMGSNGMVGNVELCDRLYDLMLVKAQAEAILPYARYELEVVSLRISIKRVEDTAAADAILREDHQFRQFFKRVDRIEKADHKLTEI